MDPLLEALNRKFVGRTPQMHDIGLRITAADRGRAAMTLPDRPDWVGDTARGRLHPGALTVLADSTCGLAVGMALQERAPFATLDLRMDYLRPAGPGHDLHCEAHCHRLSRSVAFVRAEVWQASRDEPIAVTQASFMLATPAARRAPATPSAADAQPTDAAAWQPPEASDPVLVGQAIPYVDYLGIRLAAGGDVPLFRLPYQDKLIGNPRLPALHGGVVAGFAETAATLHVIRTLDGSRVPKCIDFSIDYLRSGRPEETFAACEVLRLGARVALVQVRCWQARPDQPIAIARGHFLLTAAPGSADEAHPAATAGA